MRLILPTLAVLAAASAAAAAPERVYPPLVARLSGGAIPGGGDPDGEGRAEVRVNPGRLQLCYRLTTSAIAPATRAQLRRGVDGSEVAGMVPPKDGSSSACVEITAFEANTILRKPEAFFVTVRNDEFPDGALRGQLQR